MIQPFAAVPCALALAACAALDVGRTTPRPPQAKVAELDGAPLAYLDAGPAADEALVLVHGWACDRSVWRFQVEALAAERRVLALDLPAHGASGRPAGALDFPLFARAIAAAMDDAGVERAVLVGHSNGTAAVREFYRRHPERTLGLVVIDGALRPLFDDPAVLEQFAAPLRGPDWRAAARGFAESMLRPDMDPALRAEVVETMLRTPRDAMVESFLAYGDPALWTPDPIDVPLLCLLAAAAPFWTDEYEAWVRGLAPGVDYRKLEGVGHFVQLDAPDEVNAAIEEFLDANRLL